MKPNGTWILTVQHAGQRRTLTLGRLPETQIFHFCHNVELLLEHVKFAGKSLPPSLQAWVNDLADRHKRQLGGLALFECRNLDMTIGELFRQYVREYEDRNDATNSTKTKVRSTINNRSKRLFKIKLSVIEPTQRSLSRNAEPIWSDEAKQILASFNSWQREHYAPATWTRDNKLFSSIGIWAVKRGLCEFNPFSELPTTSMVNDERNQYITESAVRDAMEACLSPDIRVTLALGRFAGLRTCSEVRTMKWSHVDPVNGTLTIIDSKKKAPRVMPLFENIAAELERQRRVTGDTRFVASESMRSSSSSTNYQRLKEAIVRSGHETWPRLRQNLRASCENDLLQLFEERLFTAWVGHTTTVSRQHYQKMRPGDYQNAIAVAQGSTPHGNDHSVL